MSKLIRHILGAVAQFERRLCWT